MKIESPVKKFTGSVTLPDFLNIGQVRAFEDAYFGDPNKVIREGERAFVSVSDEKMLPVILDIVLEWNLEGQPEQPTLETVVMTPQNAGHELVSWIGGELFKLWRGETDIPND